MGDDRIHRVISNDGTEIAGRVRGHGPPLVFVEGGLGNGDPDSALILPFLVEHFTCYYISTRGRGLSSEHQDHSRERMFEDVAAFVEGVGEPAWVFGHSSGAVWVLGAAARAPAACRAVALYEPPVDRRVLDDDAYARFCSTEAEGRLTDALWILVDEGIKPTDEERAALAAPGVAELCAPAVPLCVREMPEIGRPADTDSFKKLSMPVLLLLGTRSGDHFKESVRFLNERLDHARVVEIEGAGHFGPVMHAKAVADELISFFQG